MIPFSDIKNYKTIDQVIDETNIKLEKIHSGELFPIKTSINVENDIIGGYYPSDQIVMAGRTGSGKTSKLLHDLYDFVDWNINPKWKDKVLILYDNLEMPGWRNILRMVSRQSNKSVRNILKELEEKIDEEQLNKIKLIQEKFRNKPIMFSNYYPNVNSWELQKIEAYKKYPDRTIINVVDHTRLVLYDKENSEEKKITGLMEAGMRLKNNYEMINIFLSQMNRNIETSVSRESIGKALPVSSDIFGSDAVQQTADVVIAYHRPGSYGLKEFTLPSGVTLLTGRESLESNDNLFIEVPLKLREGKQTNIILRHDLENNSFRRFTEQELKRIKV